MDHRRDVEGNPSFEDICDLVEQRLGPDRSDEVAAVVRRSSSAHRLYRWAAHFVRLAEHVRTPVEPGLHQRLLDLDRLLPGVDAVADSADDTHCRPKSGTNPSRV